tara:strand:- start:63 stop:1391 length:1329 start_codon:yes stop_codon:yes gene_type:complete
MAPVHDYSLDNASGANFRSDLNNALAAIVSNNSNSSEPSTKYAYQWWADTTNSVLKIRNSNNDAWITLFTLAGGVDVDAASNFNEDVTFTGASANIVFDKSDNALEFNDNAKATFGTDVDLSISHDGTTFQIFGTGAGKATVQIEGEGGADPTINFLANNTQHFSIGIDDSDADKFKISKHSALGTNDYFVLDTSGNVAITGTVTASGFSGSGASLTALNVSTDTTPQLGGDLDTNSNNINFTTGDKAQFGDNAQLKIEYDGSNSIITAGGNGDLQLTSTFDDVQIQGADNVFVLVQGGEDAIKCIGDGSVELYEDNTKVFETTASGITVTGAVTDSKGSLRSIPSNYQTSAYTLVASDAGKAVIQAGQTSVTVPNSTLTGGDAVTIINGNTGNISIISGTGLVMFFAGDGSQGNRTLGPRGIATLYFHSATYVYISGSGLS